VTAGWRRLHHEELHSLCTSSYIIRMIESRRMRWAGYVMPMEEMKTVYKIFVEKPVKNSLGRPRYTWQDNIYTHKHLLHSMEP
jgi:hypothetical protein